MVRLMMEMNQSLYATLTDKIGKKLYSMTLFLLRWQYKQQQQVAPRTDTPGRPNLIHIKETD